MKIKKFNESAIYKDELVNMFSSYPKIVALLLYEVDTIDEILLFYDIEDIENYILNYVNDFILDNYDEQSDDIDITTKFYSPTYLIYGETPMFKYYQAAINWYNEFNKNQLSIEIVKCNNEKNVKLNDNLKTALSTKKYNI